MQVFDELHVYSETARRSAALNMAIDEALLEFATAPSLRFYGWRRPSLSFGYFGSVADVENEQWAREIVRRWTGGGIVLHGDDLTYSVVLPARGAAPLPPSKSVYSQVHEAIREALSDHGAVTLAANNAPKVSQACFANPVVADVLLSGRKIAGAAQRRSRAGLLHQGSIQFETLPTDFMDAFATALCPSFTRKAFTPSLLERAEQLAREKYRTDAWLRQR